VAAASPGSHIEPGAVTADTIQVPATDVLPLLGGFDLVKLDVEGGEWDILHDPRFPEAAPPAIALEYHARASRTGVPGAEARAVLEAVGYRVIGAPEKQDGMGTLWGYKAGAV
jgi:hypothetical protein